MGDSENINETVEKIDMLIVSAIEKEKKRNDLMTTPSSIIYKRNETVYNNKHYH